MESNEPGIMKQKRLHAFKILFGAIFAFFVAFMVYYVTCLRNYVSTDNAYVSADVAQVTAQTIGTIKEIPVHDTVSVKKGDVLVMLDDADAKLASASADAQLSKAMIQLENARLDYERRKKLVKTGFVSEEELSHAKNAFQAAEAEVAISKVGCDKAKVDLSRTIIKAPIAGIVAKRQVQLGQRVQGGTPMMSLVPIDALHVDANFKEVQLQDIKVGQDAKLTSDFYGSHIVFHGKVVGFAGGTGAAFALIPAQNATGNWIKVVQRLPVRIQLDQKELLKYPLKIGLSMNVEVDTASQTK
jgi:membrane fusion protein (multidrug efflux system)